MTAHSKSVGPGSIDEIFTDVYAEIWINLTDDSFR